VSVLVESSPVSEGYPFIGQEYGLRIDVRLGRNEVHSLASLRHDGERVHDAIRPPIAALFQRFYDYPQRLAAAKVEHEGYVFQDHPRNRMIVQEPEDVLH
jgi:hypothetical protein